MIASIRSVRTALADAAAGVGLTGYHTINPAAELPCAVAWWPERIHHTDRGTVFAPVLDGRQPVEGRVTVYVSLADEAAAEIELEGYMTSVPAALESYPAAGIWQAIKVIGIDQIRETKVGHSTCLAFDTVYELLA